MSTTVAVIAAITSLAGAIATVVLGAVFERRRHVEQHELERRRLVEQHELERQDDAAQRAQKRQDRTDRYSQPLMDAAQALASRIGNALDERQVNEFRDAEARYAERYARDMRYESLYRYARFICWMHIVIGEIRVLDLGNERRNEALVKKLSKVGQALSERNGQLFLLLGGEQRTIGELMVESDEQGGRRCISSIEFKRRIDRDRDFIEAFTPLSADLMAYVGDPSKGRGRLEKTRAALEELIRLLDPREIWDALRTSY